MATDTAAHDVDWTAVRHEMRLEGEQLVRSHSYGDEVFESTVPADVDDSRIAWWKAHWRGVRPKSRKSLGELRYAELFCGAGGLALGFRHAADELGFEARSFAAVDHDAEAVDVYARNHDTLWPVPGSVTDIVDYGVRGLGEQARFRYPPQVLGSLWNGLVGTLDVLLAGPPCEGHSHLNNHSRGDDARNELYLTVPAIAEALDVPVVIIENVPAVVSDSRGVVASSIRLFERSGYHVAGGVLRADSLGWPQRRRRYFLIASRRHVPVPIEVIEDALRQPTRSITDAFESLAVSPDSHMARLPEMSKENQQRVRWLFDNDAYDLELAERPDCHRDGTTYMAVYGRMRPDEPAPTITTGFLTMGRGRFVHPQEPRVINPAEAARLQGFPDEYDFQLPDGSEPPTSKLTKWIGDAVPLPLGHAAALSALLPAAHARRVEGTK